MGPHLLLLTASVWTGLMSFLGMSVGEPSVGTQQQIGPPFEGQFNALEQPPGREINNHIKQQPETVSVTAPSGTVIEYQDENTSISTDDTYRYIVSNGLPNHETGEFPNSCNPNTISAQNHSFRVVLDPIYEETATPVKRPGIALNGVVIEPGTAERNGSWSYEAFQDVLDLGLDFNNAHVQPTGNYHYHGAPIGLIELLDDGSDLVQVAWAADGHPMYYSLSGAYESGYQLKTGTRPDIGGTYDGTYTQDFEYNEALGDLDDCNGKTIDGTYSYIVTDSFPYYPRCMHGTPDDSFATGSGSLGGQPQGLDQRSGFGLPLQRPRPQGGTVPPQHQREVVPPEFDPLVDSPQLD